MIRTITQIGFQEHFYSRHSPCFEIRCGSMKGERRLFPYPDRYKTSERKNSQPKNPPGEWIAIKGSMAPLPTPPQLRIPLTVRARDSVRSGAAESGGRRRNIRKLFCRRRDFLRPDQQHIPLNHGPEEDSHQQVETGKQESRSSINRGGGYNNAFRTEVH